MPTSVTYYEDPLNIDYLMGQVRFTFGDLDGSVYSDTTIRTSIVNAVRFAQGYWYSKYQVFDTTLIVNPQPPEVPSGYVLINAVNGQQYVPDTLVNGDVFRSAYTVFTAEAPPIITLDDETPIVVVASYLLRKLKLTSSSDALVSWSTEDIRYTNSAQERSLTLLLSNDLAEIKVYFKTKIAKPVKVSYPMNFIPGIYDFITQ